MGRLHAHTFIQSPSRWSLCSVDSNIQAEPPHPIPLAHHQQVANNKRPGWGDGRICSATHSRFKLQKNALLSLFNPNSSQFPHLSAPLTVIITILSPSMRTSLCGQTERMELRQTVIVMEVQWHLLNPPPHQINRSPDQFRQMKYSFNSLFPCKVQYHYSTANSEHWQCRYQ